MQRSLDPDRASAFLVRPEIADGGTLQFLEALPEMTPVEVQHVASESQAGTDLEREIL
jgi:hypothetical protein